MAFLLIAIAATQVASGILYTESGRPGHAAFAFAVAVFMFGAAILIEIRNNRE